MEYPKGRFWDHYFLLCRHGIGLFGGGGGGRSGDKLKTQDKNQYHKPSVFSPTNMPQSTKFNRYSQFSMEFDENIVHYNSYFMNTKLCMLLYT